MSATVLTDPRELLKSKLGWIEATIRRTASRHGLRGEEAADLASFAKLRLLENDCAVLRKFRGRSTLHTYLTRVIRNLCLDYCVQRWGKWRPSARAKSLGETAIRLDRLVNRDGLKPAEAIEVLATGAGPRRSRDELAELAARLPIKERRRLVSAEALDRHPAADRTDERLLAAEQTTRARQLESALNAALAGLDRADRELLRLRFLDGMKVSHIARSLDVEQRPLYSRLHRSLGQLRAALEAEGLTAADTQGLSCAELRIDYRRA